VRALLSMRVIEKLLIAAEELPWSSFYRAVIGFLLLPAFFILKGDAGSFPGFVLFFIAVLVCLRVIPMILRRLLPFSAEARGLWAERRILAKRFDSYQWQKLLGIALGLCSYLCVSRRFSPPLLGLAAACLICGVLGSFFWRRRRRALAEHGALPSLTYGTAG